jgi:hypothetical protein
VEREEILATSHFLGHVHHELAVILGSLAQMSAEFAQIPRILARTQGEVADSIHGDAAEPIVHVGIDHGGLLVNDRRRRITDLVPTHACDRSALNRVVDDQRLVITEVAVG